MAVGLPVAALCTVVVVAIVLSGALGPSARQGGGAAAEASPDAGPEEVELVPGTVPPPAGGQAPVSDGGAAGGPGAAGPPSAAGTLALGPVVPARPGTYQLTVSMDGQTVPGTYSVRPGSGSAQVHRTEVEGSSSEQVLAYGDGITLQSIVDANLGECRWSPPPVVAPATIDVGTSWSSSSDCTASPNGVSVSIHQESEAHVESRGHTMVGGQLVEVWVVQRHETQTRRAGGSTAVSEVVASELLAPQLGLVIERQTRADMPFPDGTVQSVTVMERIESLP